MTVVDVVVVFLVGSDADYVQYNRGIKMEILHCSNVTNTATEASSTLAKEKLKKSSRQSDKYRVILIFVVRLRQCKHTLRRM